MVNRDRGLIQLEVDLQNGAAVCFDRAAPSLILALIKDVLRRFFRCLVLCRHLDRRIGLVLTGFGQGIVLNVFAVGILIVELNGVIDVDRFPLGVHGVVLVAVNEMFIGSYSRSTVSMFRIIGDKEVRKSCSVSVLFNAADPAQELIAVAFRSCGNGNSLVDLDVLALGDQTAGVVVVPVDEGQDFLILLNIDGLEQDGVGILLARVKIILRNYGAGTILGDLCIGIVNHECFTGEYLVSGSIAGSIPLLKLPVTEHIIFLVRGLGGRSRDGLGAVHIAIAVSTFVFALADVIDHVDARGADQLAAPLGVEIHFADRGRVRRIDLVRGIESAVLGDHGRVGDKGVKAERLGKAFVSIPTGQIEIDSGAADITDHVAVIDIEGIARSGIFADVAVSENDGIARVVVGIKVDRILIAPPLGIEGQVIGGHGAEGVWITGARFVVIPSQEHIPVQRRSFVVCGGIDILLKIDVVHGIKGRAVRGRGLDRAAAAIYKDAITVDDGILVAGIIEPQSPTCAYISSSVVERRI